MVHKGGKTSVKDRGKSATKGGKTPLKKRGRPPFKGGKTSLKGGKTPLKGGKRRQMESVRLQINGHMTAMGEEILCVLEKRTSGDVFDWCWLRVFVLERLSSAAKFMCNLLQKEIDAGGGIDEEKKKRSPAKKKTESLGEEEAEPSGDQPLSSHGSEADEGEVSDGWGEEETTEGETKTSTTTSPSGKKSFSCAHCDKILHDKSSLKRHTMIHTGEKPFTCKVCNKGFIRIYHLKRHEKTHTAEKALSGEIEAGTPTGQEPEPVAGTSTEHTKTQADGEDGEKSQATGDDQPSSDTSESDAEDHDDWEESKEGQSALKSGEKIDEEEDGDKPSKKREKKKKSENTAEEKCSCTHCGKEFTRKKYLYRHVMIHTGETFVCEVCGRCLKMSSLKTHMRTHTGDKSFICKVCGKGFIRMYNLKRHAEIHEEGGGKTHEGRSSSEGQEETEPPQMKERHVEADGSTFTLLMAALKSVHDDENRETEPVAGTSSERDDRSALNPLKSQKEGNGEKLYQDLKTTSVKRDKPTPTRAKSFTCNVCEKGFTQMNHLKRHAMTHTGEKPFTCTTCGKGFIQMYHLKRHNCGNSGNGSLNSGSLNYDRTKTHRSPCEGGKIHCKICGKGLRGKAALRRHMMLHTGEKPFVCTVCGKGSTRAVDLKSHMRIHTGEKPFTCRVCGRGFSRKDVLIRHTRTHTGEKPFTCEICGKAFSVRSKIKIHMRTHTGEKPYICRICGKGCSQKGDLKRHMRRHV